MCAIITLFKALYNTENMHKIKKRFNCNAVKRGKYKLQQMKNLRWCRVAQHIHKRRLEQRSFKSATLSHLIPSLPRSQRPEPRQVGSLNCLHWREQSVEVLWYQGHLSGAASLR